MIHGPSIAIGAGISAVVLVVVFLGFDNFSNEPELKIEGATLNARIRSTKDHNDDIFR